MTHVNRKGAGTHDRRPDPFSRHRDHLRRALRRGLPKRPPLPRCACPRQAHPVSHLARQYRGRVPVRRLDDLTLEGFRMSHAPPQQAQQAQHFNPWAANADTSCRTCRHSIGWGDHHLFCQRSERVHVYPCGSWQREAGCD